MCTLVFIVYDKVCIVTLTSDVSGVTILFVMWGLSIFLSVETWLVHWAHRIEDTNAFDVVRYYYLFSFVVVRIQYKQRGYSRHALKKVSKKGTLQKKKTL